MNSFTKDMFAVLRQKLCANNLRETTDVPDQLTPRLSGIVDTAQTCTVDCYTCEINAHQAQYTALSRFAHITLGSSCFYALPVDSPIHNAGCVWFKQPFKMGDAIPYIGSKISLISKAEIRYEGYV